MELAEVIGILKARWGVPTRESAILSRQMLQLLAEGEPVMPERLADVSGQPVEFIRTTFAAIRNNGCEFNEQGALIGNALTLTPTPHHFRVNGHSLFTWCALDALFLPALIDEPAEIISVCAQTDASIHLLVSPSGIESADPSETALTIVTAPGCTSGIGGSFCGRMHFFVSEAAAEAWRAGREDIVILSLDEAHQLARAVYVEPLLTALHL